MLAYILAIALGITSLSLYLSAFFLPELHRKDDFLWSGVGLFYALILWLCAGRITGAVLLGQAAAVTLVLSFAWQTVRLRRAIAHPDEQTDLSGFSLLNWIKDRLGKKTKTPSTPVIETPPAEVETPEISAQPEETVITESVSAIIETAEPEISETPLEEIITTELETPKIEPETPELVSVEETSTIEPQPVVKPQVEPKKKGFSLKGLFGFGKSKPKPSIPTLEDSQEKATTTVITAVIEEEEWEDSEATLDTSEITTTVTSEIIPEETNWEETKEETVTVVTSEIIPEENTLEITEIIEEKEAIIVTAEITPEESEEKEVIAVTSEITLQESESEDEIEFEPFIGDDETETVIESYVPKNVAPTTIESTPDIVKPIATSESENIEESSLTSEEKKDN